MNLTRCKTEKRNATQVKGQPFWLNRLLTRNLLILNDTHREGVAWLWTKARMFTNRPMRNATGMPKPHHPQREVLWLG